VAGGMVQYKLILPLVCERIDKWVNQHVSESTMEKGVFKQLLKHVAVLRDGPAQLFRA